MITNHFLIGFKPRSAKGSTFIPGTENCGQEPIVGELTEPRLLNGCGVKLLFKFVSVHPSVSTALRTQERNFLEQ